MVEYCYDPCHPGSQSRNLYRDSFAQRSLSWGIDFILVVTLCLLTFVPAGRAMSHQMFSSQPSCYDVVIIGGGVVGLAVARAATLAGFECAVLEGEEDLLSWASGTNSGIACTGVDASPGTLERALIRDSIALLPRFLQEMSVPHKRCGSMICQWSWDQNGDEGDASCTQSSTGNTRLADVLAESHDAGDTHAALLSADQVLRQEPYLNSESGALHSAVHIPGEIVVDPWLYSISLALQAKANGCAIFTSARIEPSDLKWNEEYWTILTKTKTSESGECALELRAKSIVCATGAWAPDWEQAFAKYHRSISRSNTALKAMPRRGQYRIYHPSVISLKHPIQPVPSQRTKGIFVFPSMYGQIVVGPTALDQESKTDRSVDTTVATELDKYAQRIMPSLDPHRDLVGEYVGIRPGTNRRDYQIRTHFSPPWITVAGIRSTGLTASLGIGRHVTHLLGQVLGDFVNDTCERSPLEDPVVPTLPPLSDLVRDFQTRGDGRVEIHKDVYRVTHPLTALGWKYYKLPIRSN